MNASGWNRCWRTIWKTLFCGSSYPGCSPRPGMPRRRLLPRPRQCGRQPIRVAGEQLASVYADAGDADRLAALADALIARFPSRDKPRYYRANALLLKGRSDDAARELHELVTRRPDDVRAQSLLGVACATGGRRDCAQAAFAAALAANPRDVATHVNQGVFHLQSADPASAAESFAIALALDRTSAAARQGLAEARAAIGRR
jgi:protein O-mannosyl-transferase